MSNPFVKDGNFKCECGKEFTNSQSYNAHRGHCILYLGEERYQKINSTPHFRVLYGNYICECGRQFDKNSSYIGHTSHCEIHIGKDRYQANLEKNRLSMAKACEVARFSHTAESYVRQGQSRSQKSANGTLFQDENTFEQLLIQHKIPYVRHHSIKISNRSWYILDFLVDNKIDLEIDGKSHLAIKEKDAIRNQYLEEHGYLIYRINVYKQDNYDKLFNEFLEWYHQYKLDMQSVSSKF